MANGDAAGNAGMDVVQATAPYGLGYDEINRTRDYVAEYATRTGPLIDVWVQSAAPAHKAGRVWIKTA